MINTIFDSGTILETASTMIGIAKTGQLIAELGGFVGENKTYQTRCSFFHKLTQTSVGLTRNNLVGMFRVWHCSISFTDGKKALPYNESVASEWLQAIFGKWTSQLKFVPGVTSPGIHHYWLRCPDPKVFIDLEIDK